MDLYRHFYQVIDPCLELMINDALHNKSFSKRAATNQSANALAKNDRPNNIFVQVDLWAGRYT